MAYRVLIVDDSPAMRAFIRRVIQLSGFECSACLEAGDGAEALRILASQPVDLILTDINMPGMDGDEFVSRLKAEASLARIPVVVISTDSSTWRLARMLSAEVQGYLAKPVSPETLRAELDRALSRVER